MTVRLIESDSSSGVLPQDPPLYKGRCVFSIGNNVGTFGTNTVGAIQSLGVCNLDDLGQVASIGFARQTGFDRSGSGAIQAAGYFYGVEASGGSPFFNTMTLTDFLCGSIEVNGLSPDSDLLATMILGGASLKTKVGSLLITSTGTYVETFDFGGDTPQAVVFWTHGRQNFDEAPVQVGARAILMMGATDGTNQWAATTVTRYLGAVPQRQFTSDHCVLVLENPTAAEIVSLDPDGFTLNFSAQDDNILINYLALADVNGAFSVGDGVEGDTSIPAGFAAEAILTANAGTTDGTSHSGAAIGFGAAAQNMQRAGWADRSSTPTSYWQDAAISVSNAGASTVAEASVDAWNPTDVGLDWTTGGGGGYRFGWVALKTSEGVGWDNCGGEPQQFYRWLKR